MEIFVALTSANGCKSSERHICGRRLTFSRTDEPLLSNLVGDPQESSLFLVTLGPKLPWLLRTLLGYVAESWIGDDKMARLLRASKVKSATEMQSWQWKKFVPSLSFFQPQVSTDSDEPPRYRIDLDRDQYCLKFRKEVSRSRFFFHARPLETLKTTHLAGFPRQRP